MCIVRRTVTMIVLIIIGAISASSFATPIVGGPAHLFRDVQNAIVDGFDARRHQFPYQVSLQSSFLGDFEHSCGGSIISPTFVVTAGHCIDSYSKLRVVAGLLRLNELEHRDVQIVDVIRSYVHPGFDNENVLGVSPNDIALVKLAKRLQYTKAVKPILLPEPGDEPSGLVKLSGWGSTHDMILEQDNPIRLKQATVDLMQYEACKDALEATMNSSERLVPTMVCTGSPHSSTSGCFGDSGGPIVQDNRLIGVVSWVVRPCGTMGAPTMYTKTSYYIYFIREIVDDL